MIINILNLTSFASILSYTVFACMDPDGSVFRKRIRIQEAPEYESNTDPDPYYWKERRDFKNQERTGSVALGIGTSGE